MEGQLAWNTWLDVGIGIPEATLTPAGGGVGVWLLLILVPFAWMSVRLIASEWEE